LADFESNHINHITVWPGTGREESKAPTELCYIKGKATWGYSVPPDIEPFRWFKLLLLKDQDLKPEIRASKVLMDARRKLEESKKTATDLIGDYLAGLWTHILDTIERARSKSVLDALELHVVLTVPAIWPGYARSDMMEAAKKAGLFVYRPAGQTTLTFAPEPEAAALAALLGRGPDCKTDDVYMVCDAGGGTVVSHMDLYQTLLANVYRTS
jgi:hypothetical protein